MTKKASRAGGGHASPGVLPEATYRMLELTFAVRTNLTRVADLVSLYLTPFTVEASARSDRVYTLLGPPTVDGFQIFRNERHLETNFTSAGTVDRLLWEVSQDAIREQGRLLAVHAGAVSWEEHGLLLPAPMDSGKTTLVTGLVRAGFDYLSDEAGLVDPSTGMLQPFPKALTLEGPTLELMPDLAGRLPAEFGYPRRIRYHLRPDDVRAGAGGSPCPVGFVVFPAYQQGARTKLAPISRSEALLLLVKSCLNLDRFRSEAVSTLGRVVERARCFRLRIGDLEGSVRAVAELVGAPVA